MISACRYCGQAAMLEEEGLVEAEAVHLATMQCDCDSAVRYREAIMKADEAVTEMRNLYLMENVPNEVVNLIEESIRLMCGGVLAETQYRLKNGKRLKVKYSGFNYTIECSQSDKKKVDV